MLSVPEAAAQLGVHPGRVRQLLVQGRLPGDKVGGRWLVSEAAIAGRLASHRPSGRPLSPRAAWGLLWAANGRAVPWLSDREERRARQRARSWPVEHWAYACQHRAAVHGLYGHPSLLSRLADDGRLVRSGASVRSRHVDLVALDAVEGYVRREDLDGLIDAYGLHRAARANVVLRVPPGGLFVFGDEPDTPWPVIAVDLIDAGDDRSVRAAHELFERSRP